MRTIRAGQRSRERNPRSERDPYPWVHDEERVAIEPALREGIQESNAVRVQEVEQGMRKDRGEGREQERPKARRDLLLPPSPPDSPVPRDHGGRERDRQDGHRENPVRPAAAESERGRSIQERVSEAVYVRKVRSDEQRGCGERLVSPEPGFPERRADQRVAEVVQARPTVSPAHDRRAETRRAEPAYFAGRSI